MARPMNPLDVFATYTYHFELHASLDWPTMSNLRYSDANVSTTSTRSNGTLLINTRKDAHQIIDDVVFSYIGPSVNQFGQFVPDGTMKFKVIEPNGAFFIEKLSNLMAELNVTSINNLQFALKVFFVGRHPDNSIETIPRCGILIPMVFQDMDSTFTFKGGEYNLNFVSQQCFAGTDSNSMGNSLLAGYCNKNISVSASTVKEAITELERKLNENYQRTYEQELINVPKARPIVYKINLDPKINGDLDLICTESFAKGSPVKFTFQPSQTILSWIFQIMRGSDAINKEVGASLDNIKIEGHNGVKIISVLPRYIPKKDKLEIIYDISYYEGGDKTMEFDFMFTKPGANVDVLGFDIHMKTALAWLANRSTLSVDHAMNTSSTTPSENTKPTVEDTIVKDKTKNKLYNEDIPYAIPGKNGDIAWLNSTPRSDNTGYIKYKNHAVPGAKMMFATVSQMHSSFEPQFTFTIRGHLDLLEAGIVYPDTEIGNIEKTAVGIKAPLWIKVNMNSPDESHTPFFYTGKYNLMSIENRFVDGKFIQNLLVLMMEEPK